MDSHLLSIVLQTAHVVRLLNHALYCSHLEDASERRTPQAPSDITLTVFSRLVTGIDMG